MNRGLDASAPLRSAQDIAALNEQALDVVDVDLAKSGALAALALKAAEAQGNPAEAAYALVILSMLHTRQAQFVSAELLLKRAERLVSRRSAPRIYWLLQDAVACLAYRREELDRAATLLRRVVRAPARERRQSDRLFTLRIAAQVAEFRGDMEAMLQACYSAITLARQVGHAPQLMIAYSNAGWFQCEMCNFAAAVALLEEACRMLQRYPAPQFSAVIWSNLAFAYMGEARYHDAHRAARQSLEFMETALNVNRTRICQCLAYTFIQAGDVAQAKRLLTTAAQLIGRVADPVAPFFQHWLMALTHISEGQPEKAQQLLAAADPDAPTLRHLPFLQFEISRTAARAAAACNDYVAAGEWQRKANEAYQRVMWVADQAKLSTTAVYERTERVRRQRDAARKRERSARVRANQVMAEADLKVLQAQIEPHFLYNTLANVRYLTQNQPAAAREMLTYLIYYLRRSLPVLRAGTSTLGDEMSLADVYLRIMRIRLGERFSYRVECPEGLSGLPLPSTMLMTLVENAVKHGIEPQKNPCSIAIEATEEAGVVLITVADTGAGLRSDCGAGVGLRNIEARLSAIYGRAAELSLHPNEPCGVVASLRLPRRLRVH